ncbi:MAG: stage II sporulation protein P [Oscillospiraceae bacterium]|nr:stage II sporulation protein P [Oscillospiraceae bacterium]
MINLTVLSLKDIIRKSLKIIFAIIIIIIIAKFIIFKGNNIMDSSSTLGLLESMIKEFPENTLKQYVNVEIPLVGYVKEEKSDIGQLIPISSNGILKYELGILNNTNNTQKEVNSNISEGNSTPEDLSEITDSGSADTEVQNSTVKENYNVTYDDVKIKNTSKYTITDDILNTPFTLNKEDKNILIYHTHTCESYTKTSAFNYKSSGNFRTTDLSCSVARVGDELEKDLKQFNFNVIHDKTYFDYPAYNGSYDRSYAEISKVLSENKNYELVFDMHRDAVGSDSSYAPTVKINGEYAAQIMFVIGTDGGGLEHPNWKENLRVAIQIQQRAEKLYPGLFKPIEVSNYRYNQNLAKGASLIEVGATGNTMEQCLVSMKYLSIVINDLYK